MKIMDAQGQVSVCPKEEELGVIRHTAAHILAQAVKRLYPHAHFAFGPATENGFYYDIDFSGGEKPGADALETIEAEMRTIIRENLPIKAFCAERKEALALMADRGENYKCEHIAELPAEEELSFFRQGEYIDFCRGPHLTHTGALGSGNFCLTGISGSYWKNDAARTPLTRISGTAFRTAAELAEHKRFLAEAAMRDHRKIGREMGLFLFSDAGLGFPFFLPDGVVLRNELLSFWRRLHTENGYKEISTPQLLCRSLWEQSGHWAHYAENMYQSEIDGEPYCIKPMNCPGGVLVYKSVPHSYRELPLRLAELGLVHRHELRGTLHGLFRVRCFTQDDAHIFLTQAQIPDEIERVIRLIDEIYRKFGFSYTMELSTRPENSMGSDEDWQAAEEGLCTALERGGYSYTVNPGDGAFYGPKIDFHLRDTLGRTWQCGTIQLDFQLPQNFDLSYIDENNRRVRPVMIHRTCFGSVERFLGILTEHCAGRFPTWLAPVQVKILTLPGCDMDYVREISAFLLSRGIRCVTDDRDEKIGYKVREARQVGRVPYMVIIGARECENRVLSVRRRPVSGGEKGDETVTMTPEELTAQIQKEV